MPEKISESTVGIFSGFPPEHNAHVIETAFFVRALLRSGFKRVIGFADNENRQNDVPFDERLDEYNASGLIEPLVYPRIPVVNLHEMVSDGYGINDRKVAEIIERHHLDIAFLAYYPLFGEKLIEVLKRTRTKILMLAKIALVRDEQDPIFSSYHRGYETVLGEVDKVLACQENDKRLILQRYPVPESKIDVVPKFVDSELLAAVQNHVPQIVRKYKLEDLFASPGKVVAYIGRIDEEKNVCALLTEIWPQVIQLEPDAKLLIIGTGHQADDVRSNVSSSVRFLETSLSNLEVLCVLSMVDVLAFPSGTDYTPRIPMEALLVGTKVVLNDLNFNAIFKPYCHVVPVENFGMYRPYGYNNNMRSVQGDNWKPYGKPDSRAFAEKIVAALQDHRKSVLPQKLFASEGFIEGFQRSLQSIL